MKRAPLFILALLLAGASIYGFFRLFELRFQAGDVYPPYSSLRADPLGTKILHDALQEAPGFTVSRNYQTLDKITAPDSATIIYAAASRVRWQIRDVDRIESLARNGARIVMTFLPAEDTAKAEKSWNKKESGSKKNKDNASSKEDTDSSKVNPGSSPDEESDFVDFTKVAAGWGVSLASRAAESGTASTPSLIAHAMLPDTEPNVSWHTALYFPNPTPAWHVLYRCEGAPAIMERAFGRGSIVLAADSYFLSNEAMRAERAPRLLAWIIGSHPRVVFDETHLGVREQPGIATLIRKYSLGPLVAAIALLAGLFIWQTSSSFLPPQPDQDDSQIVTGKDSTAGFVSLLRRGIAPSRLMTVCVEQWKASLAHNSGKYSALRERIDTAALKGTREPVATYRAISQILAEKK